MYLLVPDWGPYGVQLQGVRGRDGGCQGNVGAGDKHDEGSKAIEVERTNTQESDE